MLLYSASVTGLNFTMSPGLKNTMKSLKSAKDWAGSKMGAAATPNIW